MTDPRVAVPQADNRSTAGQPDPLRIWDGVPLRNPAFTGRETMLLTLQRALDRRSKASVLPHALHGLGGVGKTQLAVEFAYRYADRYDVVWWIPAEHQTLVLQSLRDLGRRLGTPETANLQHTAGLVLEQLAHSSLRWLLIYDNANEPDDVANLIPEGGGHVILTSRNQTWSDVWDPIEVDVFDRPESIELVQKRSVDVSTADAERLAARLGDLPLALDQAASCQSATGMPVDEYLAELDVRVRQLAPGQHDSYRTTIAALVKLALDQLRATAPATAELLELFARLGAEPISGGLMRRGRDARVSAALKEALSDQIKLDRAIRQLSRYGLARVDANKRVQVHRLFQLVLHDVLDSDAIERSRTNVHRMLASANPGYPEVEEFWPVHAEIGPHIGPADLVDSEMIDARRVVLDQARYLQQIGDLEGARRLGETAVGTWSKAEGTADLGPDGELTLRASRNLAAVLRLLGFNERARILIEDAFERLKNSAEFGPDHEYTLDAATELAPNRRVAGEFREALEVDEDTVARYRRLFGPEDPATLAAEGNLAVNLRMLSDFPGAYRIDADAVDAWQRNVSENDLRLLFAQVNLARDLYGLGRYAEALVLQQRVLSPFREQLGPRHPWVLLAGRTMAVTLRKVGRYTEALAAAEEHYLDTINRYGQEHEHLLAAAMTLANSLRVTGDLARARGLAAEAVDRYLRVFGDDHPLTLAATSNLAVVLRASGDHDRARRLDERTYARMRTVLGDTHGYTLCVISGLANDYAAAGDAPGARRWSDTALTTSRTSRGDRHPYTLACEVNAALSLMADGDDDAGRTLLDRAVAGLTEVLGVDHPETVAAGEQRRAECDIEPPPT
ncbi:FxSxx-COOH system tetratricopeptide repeat protein [Krasilnikovia sp. MM14-A1004]|uniref:FxSxx-COOH system tetratricopeptide repeat protein n=1 Tax=Krasilnikovia sp. MM14-A1004 TaxID=3373541 RepID=UPI00399CFC13